ncbi:MAG: dCTP deaminase [Archaeoglobaceae archaeon]
MFLGDSEVRRLIEEGVLVIRPFDERNLQPNSYDLTLGSSFYVPRGSGTLDVKDREIGRYFYRVEVEDRFLVKPYSFCLATTVEWVCLPLDVVAFVEGKSSIGRLGLFIQNAGWVDSGFCGNITLELFNASPFTIVLYPGMRICQIVFARADGVSKGYCGKYLGQEGVTLSRVYEDFKVE